MMFVVAEIDAITGEVGTNLIGPFDDERRAQRYADLITSVSEYPASFSVLALGAPRDDILDVIGR